MSKRVLVISNGCFSSTDSNGQTLAKCLYGIRNEQLAQFFVYGTPNFNICSLYYHVADRDALKSFLLQRETGKIINKDIVYNDNSEHQGIHHKTPFKMLIRELVWKIGKWHGEQLTEWIDYVNPSCILLFLADNAFLIDFSRNIAEQRKIPIIAYSTEDYYFKSYNYITKHPSLFFGLLHHIVKKAYHRCEPFIKSGIFNTPMLTEKYCKEFKYPCQCIFAKSDIKYIASSMISPNQNIMISYLGNLGLHRHKALIEIADTLNQIGPNLKLQVYGRASDDVERELSANPNISYHGFISYDEVLRVIHESALLVHAEYADPFLIKDLRYAFSTKIADSICSGTPFLIYADSSLAETDFLKRNKCAFVAENAQQLLPVLKSALMDEDKRKEVLFQAKKVRSEFFEKNNQFAQMLLNGN